MAESEGLGFDSGEGLGAPAASSLPPRKRLLAGLKKQQQPNGWLSSSSSSYSSSPSASTVVNSPSPASAPAPAPAALEGLKKQQHQNGWLSSSSSSYSSSPAASTVVNSPSPASAPAPAALEGSGNPNLKSPQEIAETSKAAALAAAEVAAAAKRVAVEKAAVAVKAATAAKAALELAASAAAREEMEGRGFCVNIKSKPTKKKHVPIELLYKGEQIETGGAEEEEEEERAPTVLLRCKRNAVKAKHEPIKLSYKGKRIETKGVKDNANTEVMPHSLNDEELARQLHRAINSSPRISRNMGHLDARHHSEKQMDYNLCSPSSSPVSPSKKSDRQTLRFVSTLQAVVSDAQHGLEELGVCAYSKAVTSNVNDWSSEAEVCNLDKVAETVSEAMEEENFESRKNKLEVSKMEEEASCSLRCNGPAADQHDLDIKDATSVNKGGLKRKKTSLNTWNIEECGEAGLSKCSRTQIHSGNHQEDCLGQRTEGSPLTDESTLRSHAKRSNMRRNLERRTKSISEDFPQESDLSVEATSTCRRDILKPDQKFAGSVNLSSTQLSHCLPPKTPIFTSRSARRRT